MPDIKIESRDEYYAGDLVVQYTWKPYNTLTTLLTWTAYQGGAAMIQLEGECEVTELRDALTKVLEEKPNG